MTQIGRILKYIILVLATLFFLSPFLWALTTSFKKDAGVVSGATYLPYVEYEPTLDGWRKIFGAAGGIDIRKPYLTTLKLTVVSSSIAVILGSMAAYGLSRFTYGGPRFGNKDITFFFVSQRIMPPAVLAIPYFTLFKNLKLLDTYKGLVIVYVAMLIPVVVWVMVDFYSNIPVEITEAALIDGCTPLSAYWRVILPISTPGLVVALLISAILAWNDFFFSFTLTFSKVITLPVSVVALNSSKVPWWSLSASSLISVVPLIALAIVLERYLMRTSLAGAVK